MFSPFGMHSQIKTFNLRDLLSMVALHAFVQFRQVAIPNQFLNENIFTGALLCL